ncbi:MAG: bifunctional phosphoribosylaminoimidazolecarboxamide formyltransferase/IMP cyclohydrolase [Thermomicrobiales bacterium]
MRALLSVYDKTGLVEFAHGLAGLGFEIVSTGGTKAAIAAAGIPVMAVSDVTGFPEILGGRVKTLHPMIHGGILARRDLASDVEALDAHGITPFDVVAVNLYPFEATVAAPGVTMAEAVEQIDIGGPAMLRATAKNFRFVLPVCDPGDYPAILEGLGGGGIDLAGRQALAAKAYAHTAAYDAAVSEWLRDPAGAWPAEISVAGRKTQELRYGENPHQRAAAYRRGTPGGGDVGVLDAEQLAGKELSFNNMLDADAAWAAIRGFGEPAVCIVKHTIPCGLAERGTAAEAFDAALAGDPVSAFGGIVASNRPVDGAMAAAIADRFFEVIIAPGFDEAAREALGRTRALRLLRMPPAMAGSRAVPDVRLISGGLLVQDADTTPDDPAIWRVVSQRTPSAGEMANLAFAWRAVRAIKSNGIAITAGRALVGAGSGQPNRLESVRIALRVAGARAQGAALASDAFFPFADGVEAALAGGVTSVIQPGGSVRDADVIAAVDKAGAAMVFTGRRHFRH